MVIEIPAQNCKYLIQNRKESVLPNTLSPATASGVRAFYRQLPGYKPTPLVRLERLARNWGLADIFVKDEAPRFGLKEALEIGPDSTLLCFNTEGATDPVNYRDIIWHGRYPSPQGSRFKGRGKGIP
jgi:hypothetical protein